MLEHPVKQSNGEMALAAKPLPIFPPTGAPLLREAGPPPAPQERPLPAPRTSQGRQTSVCAQTHSGAAGEAPEPDSVGLLYCLGDGCWPLYTCVKPSTGVSRVHSACHEVGAQSTQVKLRAKPSWVLSSSWDQHGRGALPLGPHPPHFPVRPSCFPGGTALSHRLARGLCSCLGGLGLESVLFPPVTRRIFTLRGSCGIKQFCEKASCTQVGSMRASF